MDGLNKMEIAEEKANTFEDRSKEFTEYEEYSGK